MRLVVFPEFAHTPPVYNTVRELEEHLAVPVDIDALRAERARRRGHHMLSHLRTELYTGYSRPIYPRGAEDLPHAIEKNTRLIETAKAEDPLPRPRL